MEQVKELIKANKALAKAKSITRKTIYLPKGMTGDKLVGRVQRKTNTQKVDVPKAIEMYKEGTSVTMIAKFFDVQPQSISYHLARWKKK